MVILKETSEQVRYSRKFVVDDFALSPNPRAMLERDAPKRPVTVLEVFNLRRPLLLIPLRFIHSSHSQNIPKEVSTQSLQKGGQYGLHTMGILEEYTYLFGDSFKSRSQMPLSGGLIRIHIAFIT